VKEWRVGPTPNRQLSWVTSVRAPAPSNGNEIILDHLLSMAGPPSVRESQLNHSAFTYGSGIISSLAFANG
jgi:hypothetical protein